MGNISVGSGIASAPVMLVQPKTGHELSAVAELNVTVSESGEQYTVSAEAQYLLEMQKYFHTLDAAEQDRAIAYFYQSNEPLHNKVAETFRELQSFATGIADGRITIAHDEPLLNDPRNLLNTDFVINEKTEIGIRPPPTAIFELGDKKNYPPYQAVETNIELQLQLEALEKETSGLLRNRDAANLFGSVGNVLAQSEHMLLSAADVLHFQYAITKARETIEFVTAPEEVKTAVTNLLNKGIAWQDEKQSRMLDNRVWQGNSWASPTVEDDLLMGIAAQKFNRQLHKAFSIDDRSLLNADDVVPQLLRKQPELIYFNFSEIGEALEYYRADYQLYQKALNRDFYQPEPEWRDPLSDSDKKVFEASKSYALKVIAEIQSYVSAK